MNFANKEGYDLECLKSPVRNHLFRWRKWKLHSIFDEIEKVES